MQSTLKPDKNNGYFSRKPTYIFYHISLSSSQSEIRGNQNTYFVFNFHFGNLTIYQIMQKNIVESVKPQMATWPVRVAYWIPKAINTYSEHVILTAFPMHKLLHKRASILRYTCIACLVYIFLVFNEIYGQIAVMLSQCLYYEEIQKRPIYESELVFAFFMLISEFV